jgi:peptide deformylase
MASFLHSCSMLNLVILPDQRLHEPSLPVESIDGALAEYVEKMIATMQEAKGIGLAGVQVGFLQQVFVVQVPDQSPQVFINPEILATSQELSTYEEGCLSIPGVYADVVRPKALEIQAWNVKGELVKGEIDGLLARVFQHEFDHLNGTLFYEHLKPGTQKRLLKLYEKRNQS